MQSSRLKQGAAYVSVIFGVTSMGVTVEIRRRLRCRSHCQRRNCVERPRRQGYPGTFVKWRHLSSPFIRKHWALSRTPSQSLNPRQHLGKDLLAYRYFRHLKRDDPALPNHLCSYLDQLGQ